MSTIAEKFYAASAGAQPPRPAPDPSLPVISVVTPNYNYGRFLENCIRSVLGQDYPNIDYHIIDGGSTDSSIPVIKRYANQGISSWVSEPDRGQTDAINKGFARCTGDIFIWLNADDAFSNPQVLSEVAKHFQSGVEFLVGQINRIHIDTAGNIEKTAIESSVPVTFEQYLHYWKYPCLPQPAVFVDRSVAAKAFPLSTGLRLIMDYQFFLRCLARNPKSQWIDSVFTDFYQHDSNLSCSGNSPDYTVWDEEFALVFSAEASSLPAQKQQKFLRRLARQRTLNKLLHQQPELGKSITAGFKHPTLLSDPLFWKLFMKSMIGKNLYERARKFRK